MDIVTCSLSTCWNVFVMWLCLIKADILIHIRICHVDEIHHKCGTYKKNILQKKMFATQKASHLDLLLLGQYTLTNGKWL